MVGEKNKGFRKRKILPKEVRSVGQGRIKRGKGGSLLGEKSCQEEKKKPGKEEGEPSLEIRSLRVSDSPLKGGNF